MANLTKRLWARVDRALPALARHDRMAGTRAGAGAAADRLRSQPFVPSAPAMSLLRQPWPRAAPPPTTSADLVGERHDAGGSETVQRLGAASDVPPPMSVGGRPVPRPPRVLGGTASQEPNHRAAPSIREPRPVPVTLRATGRDDREAREAREAPRPIMKLVRQVAPLVHRRESPRRPISAPHPPARRAVVQPRVAEASSGGPAGASRAAEAESRADLEALRHDVLGQVLRELERHSEPGEDPDGLDLWL